MCMRANKIFAVVCMVGLCGLAAGAQVLIPDKNDKGKYGYVDENGSVVLKYDYAEALAFVDGKAKVRKGDKWGYIDASGKEVIKIKYSEMQEWNNGVCKVAVGGKIDDSGILSGASWGFIDESGQEVLKPEYQKIDPFIDGFAVIEKGGKFGFLNDRYSVIIPCRYSAVGLFNKHGLVWVNEGGSLADDGKTVVGGKYGAYDKAGKEIVPAKYKKIGGFLDDEIIRAENMSKFAKFVNTEEMTDKVVSKYSGTVNLLGNAYRQNYFGILSGYEIVKCRRPDVSRTVTSMISGAAGLERRHSAYSGLTEYFAANYTFRLKEKLPETDYAYIWASNRVDGVKAGLYDFSGKLVLPADKYECVGTPNDGIVFVANDFGKKKMRVNYVNLTTGSTLYASDLVYNAQDDKDAFAYMLSDFCDGVAEIRWNNQHYLIDRNGQQISDNYDYISDFFDGNAIVKKNKLCGFIKTDGKPVGVLDYTALLEPSDGLIAAAKDGKSGYIDYSGKTVIPFIYESCTRFKHGVAPVKTKDGWGMIDKEGKVLVKHKWKNMIYPDTVAPQYVWVMAADSLYYNLERSSEKLLTKTGYKKIYSNFGEDGISFVGDASGKLGGIAPSGEILLPFLFDDYTLVKDAYALMKKEGKSNFSATDAFRYVLYLNEDRNKFKLNDIIPSSMWDY